MSNKGTNTDKLYDYILSVSLKEPPFLKKLREDTMNFKKHASMQISPDQGQFLAFLVNLTGAKKTLDIGVFTGYSSLRVALTLPPEGKVIACDISKKWTSIAKKYWKEAGVDHKITLHLGPALETLNRLEKDGEDNSFDFAFIDADKVNYDKYYEKCIKLLRSGGLIAIDNTLWGGKVIDESNSDESTIAIRELNKKIYEDERVTMTLVPISDGLTLVKKK